MGIKSLAIVPPGCVTSALNKGSKGGHGREVWVWLGVGWQGTSASGFEQAAERKTRNNRGQVERGGEAKRVRSGALPPQTDSVTLFFLFVAPSFSCFHLHLFLYTSAAVAVH